MPSASPPTDPLGHDLLAQRLARIPELLLPMVGREPAPPSGAVRAARRFVVTGTGSSEAHARFLVHLLNRYAQRPAEFAPLSAFCDPPREFGRGRALIVVSQGLSPNAQVAVDRHRDFDHTVIFTSTTAAGAAAAGRAERAGRIRDLAAAGVEFVRSPLEEEYATLIRFVGPNTPTPGANAFIACLGATIH